MDRKRSTIAMVGRALLRGAAVSVMALGTGGCVSMMEHDVLAVDKDAPVPVAVVNCTPAEAPGSGARLFAESATRRLSDPQRPDLQDLAAKSDLDAGIELLGETSDEGTAPARLAASSLRGDRLALMLGMNVAQFREDVGQIDDQGADAARRAVDGPGQDAASIARLASLLQQAQAGGSDENVAHPVSRKSWNDLIDSVSTATSQDGWAADFIRSYGRLAKNLASQSVSSDELRDIQRAYLIAAYAKAYFRNGQIFQLSFSDAGMLQKIKAAAAVKFGTNQPELQDVNAFVDSLTGKLLTDICKNQQAGTCVAWGLIGEQTFVTRAGKSYGFPGVTATVDPFADKKISTNKFDMKSMVADLIRVGVEAVGDANLAVPGAPNSTACTQLRRLCVGVTAGAPDYLSAAQLAQINDAADKAEAGTTAVVGAVVRGGWLFSLNNETVAQSIETALSVSARKYAEFAKWKIITGKCSVPSSTNRYRRVSFGFSGKDV